MATLANCSCMTHTHFLLQNRGSLSVTAPEHQRLVGPTDVSPQLALSLTLYQTGRPDVSHGSTTFSSFMIQFTWQQCFRLTLSEPQKHTGGALSHQTLWLSLSFSQWGWYHSLCLFSPHQHHFCHPLSCVCLLYGDPLTVDRLCFYSLPSGCRPLLCVCVCVCVCSVCIPFNPIGACIRVWPSLPAIVMPALCLWAAVSMCFCPWLCVCL